ncbi:hypothetical protein BCV70DRAFT_202062 [Testicularia cyperi]|uniref:Uncharacterized protein n=1 Tax=Testicularia cyperi TaxID=1882483 RepID=A0A317XKC3_9BASI|nr:hypothetical protein BCV70DRAFT_202062 [Testicularia cyperi]
MADSGEQTVPVYQPPLRDRVIDVAVRHGQLTEKLQELGDVAVKLERVQHDIYAFRGKVTSQQTRLKTLEQITEETRAEYVKMSNTLAKRIMNRRGPRSRALDLRREAAEAARAQQASHVHELETNRQRLVQAERDKLELEQQHIEWCAASEELDRMDEMLFGGATPEFPEDDQAEWQAKVLEQLQLLVAAETARERRARQHLKDAFPSLTSAIKDIQTALQHCINIGVASNTKYTTQLMTNSDARATVRGTQPLVLNAKTNSGKFFTTVAKARASQLLISKPPKFVLIELYLMPGCHSPRAVDERGLHRSLEASYAQAKSLKFYLEAEIARSLERQKKLTTEAEKVLQDLRRARQECRTLRRSIVLRVVQERRLRDEEAHATATSAAIASLGHQQQHQHDAASLHESPMVSANLQLELRKEALQRLRTMIALPDPESDDDNMYPMIA